MPEYANCETVDEVLKQANPIVDWKHERRERGTHISNLRRTVRERLRNDGGEQLRQAELLLRTTTRISKDYAATRETSKNKTRSA